jgi:hypothetical protein
MKRISEDIITARNPGEILAIDLNNIMKNDFSYIFQAMLEFLLTSRNNDFIYSVFFLCTINHLLQTKQLLVQSVLAFYCNYYLFSSKW